MYARLRLIVVDSSVMPEIMIDLLDHQRDILTVVGRSDITSSETQMFLGQLFSRIQRLTFTPILGTFSSFHVILYNISFTFCYHKTFYTAVSILQEEGYDCSYSVYTSMSLT